MRIKLWVKKNGPVLPPLQPSPPPLAITTAFTSTRCTAVMSSLLSRCNKSTCAMHSLFISKGWILCDFMGSVVHAGVEMIKEKSQWIKNMNKLNENSDSPNKWESHTQATNKTRTHRDETRRNETKRDTHTQRNSLKTSNFHSRKYLYEVRWAFGWNPSCAQCSCYFIMQYS